MYFRKPLNRKNHFFKPNEKQHSKKKKMKPINKQ